MKVVHRNLLLPLFSDPLHQTSEQDSKSLVDQTMGTQEIIAVSAVISHVYNLSLMVECGWQTCSKRD